MAKVTFKGVPPWDGDYDLDLSSFTNRELHYIKKVTDIRAGEMQEALEAGDNDIMVAIALVAAKRAGLNIPEDDVWDAPTGSLVFDFSDEEADAVDPPSATPNEPVPDGPDFVLSEPGGDGSETDGGLLQKLPSPTGSPG